MKTLDPDDDGEVELPDSTIQYTLIGHGENAPQVAVLYDDE
ncbi:hypothetical protein [Haloarcula laminariae]|nr:hypothetical protein [Halomicroarcula sp. FL173]